MSTNVHAPSRKKVVLVFSGNLQVRGALKVAVLGPTTPSLEDEEKCRRAVEELVRRAGRSTYLAVSGTSVGASAVGCVTAVKLKKWGMMVLPSLGCGVEPALLGRTMEVFPFKGEFSPLQAALTAVRLSHAAVLVGLEEKAVEVFLRTGIPCFGLGTPPVLGLRPWSPWKVLETARENKARREEGGAFPG